MRAYGPREILNQALGILRQYGTEKTAWKTVYDNGTFRIESNRAQDRLEIVRIENNNPVIQFNGNEMIRYHGEFELFQDRFFGVEV